MTRFATYLTALTLLVVATACTGDDTRERIRHSVERQLERYPHSTLRDLYKNYFHRRREGRRQLPALRVGACCHDGGRRLRAYGL